MQQAIHIKTLNGFTDPYGISAGRAWLKQLPGAALEAINRVLDSVVQHLASQPMTSTAPGHYARINRRTWRRYSAWIVARDQAMAVQHSFTYLPDESVDATSARISPGLAKRSVRFEVVGIQPCPIWASGLHDWSPFE